MDSIENILNHYDRFKDFEEQKKKGFYFNKIDDIQKYIDINNALKLKFDFNENSNFNVRSYIEYHYKIRNDLYLSTDKKYKIWSIIRNYYVNKYKSCLVCNSVEDLEAHEVFLYDKLNKIQKLKEIKLLCKKCHSSTHLSNYHNNKKEFEEYFIHFCLMNSINADNEDIIILYNKLYDYSIQNKKVVFEYLDLKILSKNIDLRKLHKTDFTSLIIINDDFKEFVENWKNNNNN